MEKARISAQHAPHDTRATRSAGKTAAALSSSQDGTQGADTQGFSLLLASLADGVALPADGTLAGTTPDPAQLAAFQGGLPYGLTPGMPWQAAGEDALVAAGRWLGGGLGGGVGGGKAGQNSLVGQTALLDGAAESAAVNGTAAPAGGVATGRGHVAGRAAAALSAVAAGGDGAGRLGAAAGSALGGAAQDERKGAPEASAVSALASAASGVPAERRDSVPGGSAGMAGARNPLEGAAAVPPAGLPGLVEPSSAMGGRSAGQGGGESPAGNGSGTAAAALGVADARPEPSGPGTAFSLDAAGADPAQAGMEEQLADQVAFWVHQKTQNAELTLDRDGQPVEVTVSLTGNEAHVSFRSDQAQTREWLDTSVAQLRDLLHSEGLQLSGVSVGTSGDQGSRDDNAQRDTGRQGARQASVQAVVPAGTRGRVQPAADRSVDIFV